MRPAKTIGILAFIFLTLFINPGFAQQEMLFRVRYLPNRTYTSHMVNDIKMEMDFPGDTAITRQMQAKGMKLPMHMDMLQEMKVSIETGALMQDKRIPVTTTYDNVDLTMKVAGQEIKQPDRLKGTIIKGHVTENGKLRVDSIVANAFPEQKEILQKYINSLMNAVQFPDKPMKPGDTFTQELPMVVPAGGTSFNLLLAVVYTLREIKGDQAFFDFTQQVKLDLSKQQGSSTATGQGSGKLIYNIPANYITNTDSDITMDMTMIVREMNMKIKARATSSLKAGVL